MHVIHYSPNHLPNTPAYAIDFDMLVIEEGKAKAIAIVSNRLIGNEPTAIYTRWWLPIAIAQHAIRVALAEENRCLAIALVEHLANDRTQEIRLSDEGELIDPLDDNDEYQFELIFDGV